MTIGKCTYRVKKYPVIYTRMDFSINNEQMKHLFIKGSFAKLDYINPYTFIPPQVS